VPVFGLVVAGPYDDLILSTLVRRIRPDVAGVKCRACGNDPQVTTKFRSYLKELRYANDGRPVDKAIVVRDCHRGRGDPAAVLDGLRSNFREQEHPFPVRFAVVQPEPEAWLLADQNALAQLAAERGHPTDFTPLNFPPEQLPDPKEELKSLLRTAGVPYTRQAAARLAEVCDLGLIEALCPSFTFFKRAVTDC